MNYITHAHGADSWGHGHGGGVWGWLFALLMISLLILGVVLAIRLFTDGTRNYDHDAMDTLKHRYAKGEITKKQFEEIKKDIE